MDQEILTIAHLAVYIFTRYKIPQNMLALTLPVLKVGCILVQHRDAAKVLPWAIYKLSSRLWQQKALWLISNICHYYRNGSPELKYQPLAPPCRKCRKKTWHKMLKFLWMFLSLCALRTWWAISKGGSIILTQIISVINCHGTYQEY